MGGRVEEGGYMWKCSYVGLICPHKMLKCDDNINVNCKRET